MELKEKVIESLKEVYDPELGINVVDLGLIYKVEIDDKNNVYVEMTLTTPECPLHNSIVFGVKNRVDNIPEIATVEVKVVWEPAWSPEKISERAAKQLGLKSHLSE